MNELDDNFYEAFVAYLTFDQNLAVNTVGKNVSILKVFVKYINKRKAYNIDTTEWFAPREDTDSVALTKEELEKLYNKDLTKTPHLEKVRDLFVIGCKTGLRFSDFTNISADDIEGNTMFSRHQKTGKKVKIPLLEYTKQILEKYDYKLPKAPVNQVFNRQIKDACELAEIKSKVSLSRTKGGALEITKCEKHKKVSSHTARRTFATILYHDGIPYITIMAITGHSTVSSFLRYIKVTTDEHANIVEEFYAKKENKEEL